MPHVRAVSGLLVLGVFSATRLAAADAQECVAQNNSGADHRASHQLLAARDAYRACTAEPGCPGVVRAECESALADLKTAIPTLLVSVLDAQRHDVVGATLTVDGRAIAIDGSPVEVDPGPHVLSAAGRGLSTSMQVVSVENEANRQVEVVLSEPTPEPASVSASAGGSSTLGAPSRVPAYVLGGVGALAAVSFGYLALSGRSEYNALEQCKPGCTYSDVHDVRTKYELADVSLGVSVVALAAAGYFLFRSPHERPVTTGSLSVDMTAAPQAASFSLRWVQ
jgi:hypothetical protein